MSMKYLLIIALLLTSCESKEECRIGCNIQKCHYNSSLNDAICICKKFNSEVHYYTTYSIIDDLTTCKNGVQIDITEKCIK